MFIYNTNNLLFIVHWLREAFLSLMFRTDRSAPLSPLSSARERFSSRDTVTAAQIIIVTRVLTPHDLKYIRQSDDVRLPSSLLSALVSRPYNENVDPVEVLVFHTVQSHISVSMMILNILSQLQVSGISSHVHWNSEIFRLVLFYVLWWFLQTVSDFCVVRSHCFALTAHNKIC